LFFHELKKKHPENQTVFRMFPLDSRYLAEKEGLQAPLRAACDHLAGVLQKLNTTRLWRIAFYFRHPLTGASF
jgi:hypothetical protein